MGRGGKKTKPLGGPLATQSSALHFRPPGEPYLSAKVLSSDSEGRPHSTSATEPSVLRSDGVKQWHKHGALHREGGPAVEYPSGSKIYYKDGKYHREDGPARILSDGGEEYYKEGLLHRTDGPALVRAEGIEEWHVEGRRHRVGAPAVSRSDYVVQTYNFPKEEWWENGKRHRLGGPAVIRPLEREWWENGKKVKTRRTMAGLVRDLKHIYKYGSRRVP